MDGPQGNSGRQGERVCLMLQNGDSLRLLKIKNMLKIIEA